MTENPMSFEKNIARINEIIEEIESSDTGIDRSLELYQVAVDLAMVCEKVLESAEQRVEILSKNAVGTRVLTPFSAGSENE